MPTKRCCGCGSCLIGSDLFDRADENPVTGQWQEISGDWEIDGNELNSITDGPLITLYRQPSPMRVGKGYNSRIVVDIVVPASGDAEWGIITAYRGTGDYNWVKLEFDSSTGFLSPTFYTSPLTVLMDVTTHPGGELWSPTPGDKFTMELCCAHVEWTCTNAGLQGDVIWQTCTDGGLDALPTAPLGGVGLLFGRFDNWYYYQHWESRVDCPRCFCFCLNPDDIDDYSCLPDELTLTITPDQVGLTCCIDNLELTLHLAEPDVSGAVPVFNATPIRKRWYSDTFECEGETMWFILSCDVDNPLVLSCVTYPSLDPGDDTPTVYLVPRTYPDSAECNPVILQYDMVLSTGVTTCDLDPGPGTGIRPLICTGDCWLEGDVPVPTWSVTIVE